MVAAWYLVNLPGNKLNIAVKTEKNSIAADCLNKVSLAVKVAAEKWRCCYGDSVIKKPDWYGFELRQHFSNENFDSELFFRRYQSAWKPWQLISRVAIACKCIFRKLAESGVCQNRKAWAKGGKAVKMSQLCHWSFSPSKQNSLATARSQAMLFISRC